MLTLSLLLVACAPGRSGDPAQNTTPADTHETDCEPLSSAADSRFDAVLGELERELDAAPDTAAPAGVAVAVVQDGVLISAGGVGKQAKEGQVRADLPVDADTIFFIASTSKWITATAAMALVESGSLDLQEPIVTWMPDYTETNGRHGAITLHHLLTMTSGLANDGGCWLYSESAEEVPEGCAAFTHGPGTVLEELFQPEVLDSSPYDGSYGVYNLTSGEPGEAAWHYSNWGIMLAGRVLEVVAGQPFPDLVAERVLQPACMETAGYTADGMTAADDYAIGGGPAAVDGYCPEPELGNDSVQPFLPDELACPARAPNGGVRASAVDLGRFAEAMLGDLEGTGRMVSQDNARRMFCPGGGSPGSDCQGRVEVSADLAGAYGDTYGYTNFRHEHRGREVYTHGGGRAGFGALFWLVPSEQFAVVMLSNDDGASVDLQDAAGFALDCYLDGDC